MSPFPHEFGKGSAYPRSIPKDILIKQKILISIQDGGRALQLDVTIMLPEKNHEMADILAMVQEAQEAAIKAVRLALH